MKIGLYDVDSHNFPNLPLMKISAYHKSRGDEVEIYQPLFHYDRIGKANSKIIAQFDKSGNFIKNYNSIIEAERQTNISNGTICDVLKGRRKSAGGFLWEYAQ